MVKIEFEVVCSVCGLDLIGIDVSKPGEKRKILINPCPLAPAHFKRRVEYHVTMQEKPEKRELCE